jgi:TRAP-type transport system periplasmic protein
MRKYIVLVLVCLIFFGSIVAIKAAEEYKFTVATNAAVGSEEWEAVQFIAEQLEERTDGRIKCDGFGPELGSAPQQIENVMVGNQTAFFGELTWMANLHKDFNITAFAFLFQDNQHLIKFLESEKGTEMWNEILEETGVNVLSFHGERLPRVVMSKKPLFTLDDFQNLKMRVPEIEMYMRVWDALGTDTNRVTWGEMYMALAQGLIEAHEGPIGGIYEVLTHEQAPYMMRTDHIFSLFTFCINDKFYQNLPEDLKQNIQEVIDDAMKYVTELELESEDSIVKSFLDDGTIIIYNEKLRDQLRDKLAPLAPKFEEEGFWSEGLYDYVIQLRK